MTYGFLQHYGCFVEALLGGLLISLLFVQGVNAVVHSLSYTEESRQRIYNSVGNKWILMFVALIVCGCTLFATFPVMAHVCFGGAYLLWAILLITIVLQTVSYVLHNKVKSPGLFQSFLTLNGYVGPMVLGGILATFFEGADFFVGRDGMIGGATDMPVDVHWANSWHGLDILLNPWVLVFGVSVFFLARILGLLYIMHNIADNEIQSNGKGRLIAATVHFAVLFLIYLVHLLIKEGYAYDEAGFIYMEANKYLNNFALMWYLSITLLAGFSLILYGAIKTLANKTYTGGIWPARIGTVLLILALMLCAMWNHTAYYPSAEDLQSSLTMVNSCSSESTLRKIFYASLLIPLGLAYVVYRWWYVRSRKLDKENKEI